MEEITFERTNLDGNRASYTFIEQAPGVEDARVEGMFEVDLEQYQQLEVASDPEAVDHAIYWLTPIQEDRQYWVGMKVFFRIYKHYLTHGTYIERG